MFRLSHRVLALDSMGAVYELDPDDGTVRNRWADGDLPFDERTVTLDGQIHSVLVRDDDIVVSCTEGSTNVAAFSPHGERLWRDTESRGRFYDVNGELVEEVARGFRQTDWYRIDPQSGTRDEEIAYPF